MLTNESPALGGSSGPGSGKDSHLDPSTKRASILRVFLARGADGINCFEAVRWGHDYVLRSTVAQLQADFGVPIMRRWETVPGHNGSSVRCMRYWLGADGRERALELLEGRA